MESKGITKKEDQFLTFKIGNEWFGFSITMIRDVLYTPDITYVPLSSPEVAGLINLRGHIVTAIYLNQLLNIESLLTPVDKSMSIVVQGGCEKAKEPYGFIVDKVFDIENFDKSLCEPIPSNLHEKWNQWAQNIYRLSNRLLIILSRDKILDQLIDLK